MVDRVKFRKWVRQLKRKYPSSYPIYVYLIKMPDDDAGGATSMTIDGKLSHFVIRVSNSLNDSEAADTLAEEYSHCLRMHLFHLPGDDHDEIYAAIFGIIKRQWLTC